MGEEGGAGAMLSRARWLPPPLNEEGECGVGRTEKDIRCWGARSWQQVVCHSGGGGSDLGRHDDLGIRRGGRRCMSVQDRGKRQQKHLHAA
jgi:hypothetical protein